MLHALCSMLCALCPVLYALCPSPFVCGFDTFFEYKILILFITNPEKHSATSPAPVSGWSRLRSTTAGMQVQVLLSLRLQFSKSHEK